MFRQYTRSINLLANQLLTLDSNLVVLKPTEDKKSFIVKGSLAPEDLCHTTEIYTMFGRMKIIIEGEKLLVLTQPSKVPVKSIKEFRFYEPTLYLISNHSDTYNDTTEIFKKLSQMKSIFFEKSVYKLNDEVKCFIDETSSSIKLTRSFLTCAIHSELHNFTLTPETIISFENLKKQINDIDAIMSSIPLTKYTNKK